MLTVFVIMGGVISSALPVIAATENAYVRRNLVRTYDCKTICCRGRADDFAEPAEVGRTQVARPG